MLFIIVLIAAATAIAGSAAFFSVYGLAYTFSGTFWSVVVMGTSLELGKLVAASYLYRYWDRTHITLKAYLMTGVLALMVLTSTGIFGYLSTGYQADVLPLKQAQEQVKNLEEEKIRILDRKKQIDVQISQLPTNSVKGRTQLMKGFKDEQTAVTARIAELDKEMLTIKQQLIQTEAHIGPITYIATAFGLGADNATKYLIYLIIFAFDPMAVALTLAVNIAQRLRKEEIESERQAALLAARVAEEAERDERKRKMQAEHEERMFAESLAAQIVEHNQPTVSAVDNTATIQEDIEELQLSAAPIADAAAELIIHNDPIEDVVDDEPELPASALAGVEPETCTDVVEPSEELVVLDPTLTSDLVSEPAQPDPVTEDAPEEFVQAEDPPTSPPAMDLPPPIQRHQRPYPGIWTADGSVGKIDELVAHLQWLKTRQNGGETLSNDDRWELQAIEDILSKHGYSMYL